MKNGKAVAAAFAGLALGAASPVARAQSSVTLYGVIDTAIDISNQGHGTLVRETSGAMQGSRWGFIGKEDLGGGYQAIFTLENGFNANTGTAGQGGLLFGRQAFVGFTGPQGTLTFGRQYSPEFWAFTYNDAFLGGLQGGLSDFYRTLLDGSQKNMMNAYASNGRTNNSVVYKTPNLYGFTVTAMYAFGGVPGSIKDGQTVSGWVNYTLGGFAFNGAYLRTITTNGAGDLIAWTAGGTYTIGPAQIFLAYSKDTDTTANTPALTGPKVQFSLVNLGLRYQITPALTAMAQVVHVINTSDGLSASQNAYIEAIGLQYALSKRTAVFASYGQVQNKNGSTYSLGGAVYLAGVATPNSVGRTFQLGMRTSF
ncbi:porin [Caballeronia sp. LZ043]|uniref:porin n=1 Tax=Caballeronia sp. LZ043 TaxID=3038569 RepID=UPI00285E8ABD|nr:porin [Caballeronia sp. LZ043]MDR5823649.1 porin [Caballeronia sp. LZ043]